jgi:uncharacterized protein YcnI
MLHSSDAASLRHCIPIQGKLMKKSWFVLLLGLAIAPAVWSHATFDVREAVQNTTVRVATRIPHGCSGESTLRLRIAIPDGLIAVQPMPKPGWELTVVRGPYAAAHTLHGRTLTEGVRELIWSGELPDAYYDEFIWRARFTDRLPAGETLYIPVVQECANGAERWIETPLPGQSSSALRYPAPGIRILGHPATAPNAAHGHSHPHGHSHANH